LLLLPFSEPIGVGVAFLDYTGAISGNGSLVSFFFELLLDLSGLMFQESWLIDGLV
jgi:hypothetical protein